MLVDLDERVIAELSEIMGDDLKLLLDTFVSDTTTKLSQLNVLKDSQDHDAIRRMAHNIKGSCKNIGAKNMADYCEKIEVAARAGEISGFNQEYENLFEAFISVKHQLVKRFS